MFEKIIKIPNKSFNDLTLNEMALMIEADSSISPLISSEFFTETAPYCAEACGRALRALPRFNNVRGFHPGTLHDSLLDALKEK